MSKGEYEYYVVLQEADGDVDRVLIDSASTYQEAKDMQKQYPDSNAIDCFDGVTWHLNVHSAIIADDECTVDIISV